MSNPACLDCQLFNDTASSSSSSSSNATTAPSATAANVDPSAASPPNLSTERPCVAIEFCNRCRWLHRATWTQTELFLTFGSVSLEESAPKEGLASICLIPREAPDTAGRWRVWLWMNDQDPGQLIWDRKTEGGFGEMKVLKQRLRDVLQPHKSLGHSDKTA